MQFYWQLLFHKAVHLSKQNTSEGSVKLEIVIFFKYQFQFCKKQQLYITVHYLKNAELAAAFFSFLRLDFFSGIS